MHGRDDVVHNIFMNDAIVLAVRDLTDERFCRCVLARLERACERHVECHMNFWRVRDDRILRSSTSECCENSGSVECLSKIPNYGLLAAWAFQRQCIVFIF